VATGLDRDAALDRVQGRVSQARQQAAAMVGMNRPTAPRALMQQQPAMDHAGEYHR
jgi:hypothetical protein